MNISKCLFVLLIGLVAGCGSKVDEINSVITLENERGEKVEIEVSQRTLVIAMGTWCPACQEFYSAIQNPALNSVTSSLKIVYVFETNEWPGYEDFVRKQLEGGEAEEYLAELRERAQGAAVVDPGFLKAISGHVYFLSQDSGLEMDNGVPSAYMPSSETFAMHPWEWLIKNTELTKSEIVTSFE